MSRFASAIIQFSTNSTQAKAEIASVNDGLKGFGKTAQDALGGVGAITAAVARATAVVGLITGAVTLLTGAGRALNDMMEAAEKRSAAISNAFLTAFELSEKIRAPSRADSETTKIAQEKADVLKAFEEADKALQEFARNARGRDLQQYYEQRYENQRRLAEALTEIEDSAGKRAAASASDRLAALNREAEDAEMKRLEGVDRIRAEEARAIADIAKRREAAGTDEERAALDRIAAATSASADAEVKKTQKAKEEAEQRAKDQVAAAVANQKALEDSYRKIVDNFTKEVTAGISRISDAQRTFAAGQFSGIAADVARIGDLVANRLRSVGNGV
jgi:hypothetical protein